MPRRSEQSLAALLLTDRLVDGEVEPLSASQFWALIEEVGDPSVLLGLDVAATAKRIVQPEAQADRVQRLLARATRLAFELERLEQSGIQAVSALDPSYPPRLRQRLGPAAPPVLYVVGPLELLENEGLGIVGSREVTPEGAEVARRAATAAVERGWAVISGGAKGVDQVSMAAAFQAGGQVVGVLPDSLERRLKDADTRRAVTQGTVCLATPYKPSAGFSVANAMSRNKIIYALARCTFVVASDLGRGGTWEGAAEALRRNPASVVIWLGEGAGPGNQSLVSNGARGVESIEALFEPEGVPQLDPAQAGEQLRLGL